MKEYEYILNRLTFLRENLFKQITSHVWLALEEMKIAVFCVVFSQRNKILFAKF